MSRNMEQLLYEKRLNRLRLFSLNRWLKKNMIKVYETVIVQRKQIRNYYVLVFIIQEWQGSTWSYKAENFKRPKRPVFFPPRWLIISLWNSFFSKFVDPKMEKCTQYICSHYRAHYSKVLNMIGRKKSIKSSCRWKLWAQRGCKPRARKGRKNIPGEVTIHVLTILTLFP